VPTPTSERKAPADRAVPSDVPFDAILVVSFGGPEGPDDVMPFLENVSACSTSPITTSCSAGSARSTSRTAR
jgi:ferrochelatase